VPNISTPAETGLHWYALHVRSRYEKSVSTVLRNKGFDEFLPVYQSRRQWSQRIAEIDLPLFPGYVFCRFEPSERRIPIVTTPGVMGIVGFGGTPIPIDDGEIEAIHRVLATGIAAEPWKYMPTGQRVRIEHGALAGLEGIFVEVKKNHRLLLSLTLLQRSVAIQIDAASVVPVNPARGASSAALIAGR
jgi:transcription termination/antitermination protein NusG